MRFFKFFLGVVAFLSMTGIAFGGHIVVSYQFQDQEILYPDKPVGSIIVDIGATNLQVFYRDGSSEILTPDGTVTAVNTVLKGKSDGHAVLHYQDGSQEQLTPDSPVNYFAIILSQRFLVVSYMDGREEHIVPPKPVHKIEVVFY